MKICTRCKVEKPESEFYESATSRGGYRQPCKNCVANWHRTHRDKLNTGKSGYGDQLVNEMMRRWR